MIDVDRMGNVFKDGKKVLPNIGNGYYRKKQHGKISIIHRLVAIKYIPNPNNLKTVNHINGNKLDNRVENLEWLSNEDNVKHAWRTGLTEPNCGEKHGHSKLDDCKVLTLRTFPMGKQGSPNKYGTVFFANLYGVGMGNISIVWRGLNWTHIPKIR